jgi:cytochrome c oxidase assembly factor CtaG
MGPALALLVAAVAWVVADRRSGHPGGGLWWWSGIATLAVALLGPIDAVADRLMCVHMTQHLLLGLVAPLLIVRARPMRLLGHLAEPSVRRRWSRRTAPLAHAPAVAVIVVVAHVGAWAAWHVPRLYDEAIAHDAIHVLEHLTLFATGLALWAVAWPAGPVRRAGGAGVLCVFFAASGTGAIAALLVISDRARYATDPATLHAWGLTRLQDQQLAGAIMWVPGGFVYLVAGVVLFATWLSRRPSRQPDLSSAVLSDAAALSDR